MRMRALQALELTVRQFRGTDAIWPFRVPHEPIDLERVVDAVCTGNRALNLQDLHSRPVLEMQWNDGQRWRACAITLASGVHVYCDESDEGTRVLTSVKRGNPLEADRFFLELLAESRGDCFGIEMGGTAPDLIRTPIDDRDFLCDVFVDLLEDTTAEQDVRAAVVNAPPGISAVRSSSGWRRC